LKHPIFHEIWDILRPFSIEHEYVFFQKLFGILQMVGVGLYCEFFFSDPFFSGGALSTFIHLSVGKDGPFTLENHIHFKS